MSDGNVNFFKKDGMEGKELNGDDIFYSKDVDESKYFESNEKNMKPILILLDKAEQILSILNLADNTIKKYNELKQLTFDKLSLDFTPLVKQNSVISLNNLRDFNSKNQINNLNLDNFWNIILRERNLNNRKNQIIEFLLEIIEKFVFELNSGQGSGNYFKKFLYDKENYFIKQFEKLISYEMNNSKFSKNLEDLEFEMKIEEIKIKEYLNKSEMSYKKFISNLNLKHSHLQNKILKDNDALIINELENKIEEMKKLEQVVKKEFLEKFNELRMKYNPELENEYFKIKNDLDESRQIFHKISEMIFPFYEKYYNKNYSWYQKEKIEVEFKELEQIHFLISLTNKFFNDNKYLIDLLSTLEKEKTNLTIERNSPFVTNSIEKNNLLVEMSENYKILENNSNNLYHNFKELMEFINKNFDDL